jgi:glutathione synthase/RimK-type ligase-like ATP-grasp enzyme
LSRQIAGPRLLLVSANSWATAGQTALALVLSGFAVAVVGPADSPIHLLRKLHAHFPYKSENSSASIKFAIAAWSPDILVLADDVAAQALRSLYLEASRKPHDPDSIKLIELLEYSFGDLHSFVDAQSKSEIFSLAASLGIACPKTVLLTDDLDLTVIKDSGLSFPLIVKTDDAWGGLGVRIVNDRSALVAAIAELSLPYNLPDKLKRIFGRMLRMSLLHRTFGQPRKISLQQYVVGRPCTRAVVCWKGRVLAGVTVDVLATLHEFGPSAVVKVTHRTSVADAAEKLVAKLGLSGFLGFDFMLDVEDNSWFLEMNPRATPTCHISTVDHDLPGSLFAQITGTTRNDAGCTVDQQAFALFPYGARRTKQMTPDLPLERGAPLGEPEYIKRCRVQEDSKIQDWIWYSDSRASTEV